MKKYFALILVVSLMLTACGGLKSISGDWKGTVLFMEVQYSFRPDGTFEVATLAANGVMVGGGRGQYHLDTNTLQLNYQESYHFDSESNTGNWRLNNKIIRFDVQELTRNSFVLQSQGQSELLVELSR